MQETKTTSNSDTWFVAKCVHAHPCTWRVSTRHRSWDGHCEEGRYEQRGLRRALCNQINDFSQALGESANPQVSPYVNFSYYNLVCKCGIWKADLINCGQKIFEKPVTPTVSICNSF